MMTVDPAAAGDLTHRINGSRARVQALARRAEQGEPEELRRVTREFEALFVKMMLDSMRDTLNGDGLIPKNAGEKLFEDKLYDEYAQTISRTADLGLAAMMYNQLSRFDSRS